jgi:hypothetical protein
VSGAETSASIRWSSVGKMSRSDRMLSRLVLDLTVLRRHLDSLFDLALDTLDAKGKRLGQH